MFLAVVSGAGEASKIPAGFAALDRIGPCFDFRQRGRYAPRAGREGSGRRSWAAAAESGQPAAEFDGAKRRIGKVVAPEIVLADVRT